METSNIYDLKEAPIKKVILKLSLPMILGVSLSAVYNLINAYFIGLIQDTLMLSAITLCLPIITFLMAISAVFGVGGSTYITRLLGEEKLEQVKPIAGYSFYASMLFSLMLSILVFHYANPVAHFIGADAQTLYYTQQYIVTLFIGAPFIVANFTLEQLVRAEGANKESMYGMVISIVISIILDYVLILIYHMNIVGAALSTVIANGIAALYYIYFLNYRSETLRGFMRHIKISLQAQVEIYKIGIAELFKFLFLIVTTLLLNHYAAQYGGEYLASLGIVLRIVQLPEFIIMGIFIGVMPLIAYNYGAKNYDRLKSVLKYLIIIIISFAVVFSAIVYIFKYPVFMLFTVDEVVLKIGMMLLVAQLISLLFNGLTGLFTDTFQSSGVTVPTMIMATLQGILFIPVVIILHYYYGMTGLIWSMTVTELITFLVGIILFIRYYRQLRY